MSFRPDTAARQARRDSERQANMAALMATKGRTASYGGSVSGVTIGKEGALQHAGYMAAVRGLGYCMRCRRSCRPQFCHRDQGKGMGLKTDVREGWPGCVECHWLVGTSGQYAKQDRRALELELAQRTRDAVQAAGTWPARLPAWDDNNEGST